MAKVPIGISDFKSLREGGYYFVDKSELIAEVLDHPAQVLLLPRPRRFGKTLNLSMLRTFLDIEEQAEPLFRGLSIDKHPDALAHRNSAPVIYLTFKDLKTHTSWESCQGALRTLISDLYLKHRQQLERATPRDSELSRVQMIWQGEGALHAYQDALLLLTRLLQRASGQKVYVLIDEYDLPIHAGQAFGYGTEIVNFIRGLLGSALKDNPALEKGVMTGVLRVARDSIFSGLNNLTVHSLLDRPFSNRFGFTEAEVSHFLRDQDMAEREAEVRRWYNGYRFGETTIYNPWSIVSMAIDRQALLCPHWIYTAENSQIAELITDRAAVSEHELTCLLQGEALWRKVDIAMPLARTEPETVWSLLLFSGYLKAARVEHREGQAWVELAIPNLEVHYFFKETVAAWVRRRWGVRGVSPFLSALLAEDEAALDECFNLLIRQMLSYHDTAGQEPERVYHAFALGLLEGLEQGYRVTSNREAGYGRYDICARPRSGQGSAFLFEFKKADSEEALVDAARKALTQIIEKGYQVEMKAEGIKTLLAVGIGLFGKKARVVLSNLKLDG